jgi:hypothetical protein
MTAKDFVLQHYPDAEALHNLFGGLLVYAICIKPCSHLAIGEGYWRESKAWVAAKKNIETGKEPWKFR